MPKILKYLVLFLLILTVVFLLTCNKALADIAAFFVPTAYVWVFAALLFTEAVAFYWLWCGMFARQDHLAFDVTDTEDLERLKSALVKRLYENLSSIKDAELKKDSPNQTLIEECHELLDKKTDVTFVKDCLSLLNKEADKEIKRTAKGIFLATALSQNGRIDAFIVFVGLCRMVWRISSIYNQKPHPSEVVRLYWAVAIPTFLAYSIEELDIASEISASFGDLLNAVVPAIAIGGTPILGTALQRVTASAIDGAANCFLALRTGIITRNTYAYILTPKKKPNRGEVFSAAGGMLLNISGDALTMLLKTARTTTAKVGGAAIDSAVKTGETIKEAVADFTARLTELAMNSTKIIKSAEQEKLTREETDEDWEKIVQTSLRRASSPGEGDG